MNANQHSRAEQEQAVRDWVARDPFSHGYLLDFFQRGARVCHVDEKSLVLANEQVHVCYAAGAVSEDVPEVCRVMLLLTDDAAAAKRLVDRGLRKEFMECRQAIYQGPALTAERPGVSVRPLTMADLDFVVENYHNPGAYAEHIRGRIEEGMVGGIIDGHLAGFAGIHQEGAMGMLEVLPEFRRQGLAEVLETAVINQQLQRGRLPYCHVRVGNTASEALQQKLGLIFDDRPMFWLE